MDGVMQGISPNYQLLRWRQKDGMRIARTGRASRRPMSMDRQRATLLSGGRAEQVAVAPNWPNPGPQLPMVETLRPMASKMATPSKTMMNVQRTPSMV